MKPVAVLRHTGPALVWRALPALVILLSLLLFTHWVRDGVFEREQSLARERFQQAAAGHVALVRNELQRTLRAHRRLAQAGAGLDGGPPGAWVDGFVAERPYLERIDLLDPDRENAARPVFVRDRAGAGMATGAGAAGGASVPEGEVRLLRDPDRLVLSTGLASDGRWLVSSFDLAAMVETAFERGGLAMPREVALRLVDPQAGGSGFEHASAPLSWVESIELGSGRWLVLAWPAHEGLSLRPGAALDILNWGGWALSLAGAFLVLVLQSIALTVRRRVRQQTEALALANDRLRRANADLQVEVESRMRSEIALWETTSLQRAILESANYAILSTDTEGVIQLFNPAAERMFGWRADEVCAAASVLVLFDEEGLTQLGRDPGQSRLAALLGAAGAGRFQSQDCRLRRRDGSLFHASLVVSTLLDAAHDASRGYLFIAGDVSRRREAEGRVSFLSHFDVLTELPNRSLLQIRLSEALLRAQTRAEKVGVLFLDLDRFKNVNESLGHQSGDRLLQSVSRRLGHCMREQDLVARTGGDEFVAVLPGLDGRTAAADVAERILQALSAPFTLRDHVVTITPSLGVALFPEDGRDAETLLRNADAAMYAAKEQGRNTYRFFEARFGARASERLMIESRLHRALERGELALLYQPQVHTHTGEFAGFEALVRLRRDEAGGEALLPERFIPVAEDSGLIVPIGDWVLETAARQCRAWMDQGLLDVPVAVNVSARQFDEPDLARKIDRVLKQHGLSARHLELELTESLVMRDPERSSQILTACRQLGLKLAIDDFGTGYSSLAYLRRFPIDRLKIDRSFIKDIESEPDDATIVQTIVVMAHTLGMSVLAEGVETPGQLKLLRRWGCDAYQGYLCARPMVADDISAMMAGLRAAGVVGLQYIDP